MRPITIDYTPAYQQGAGIGRLVRELVKALAHYDAHTPYQLFVLGAHNPQLPPEYGANFSLASTRLSVEWLARLWHRARIPLPVTVFTGTNRLYHATDFVLPPLPAHIPSLLTVHDLSFVRVPHAASPRLRAYLEAVVPRSASRATHILADSQASKDDLCELYGIAPEKITVLLSGVSEFLRPVRDVQVLESLRVKYALNRPYMLSVGTVQPRKNYSRLIQALAQLRASGEDVELAIVGGRGWLQDEIERTLIDTQMRPYVKFLGFVPDADLPALYSAAHLVAFPSLYEGFGFPVLEGMACGVPVLTSNVSSLPEVAGSAALMVNPLDLDDIVFSLRRLLNDTNLRQDLVQRGFEQVKRFTWANSAKSLHNIYQQFAAP